MSGDPIKAALLKACDAAGLTDAGIGGDGYPLDAEVAAAAIAAFLRSLPKGVTIPNGYAGWAWERWLGEDLAASVEKAARDG